MTHLLENVHEGLVPPGEETSTVLGTYQYFHYGCDGQDDRGWGCGYRSLQTICSWVKHQQLQNENTALSPEVPSVPDIQAALVAMQDKPEHFLRSKQWIGSFEVSICVDYFYNVPCKIIHIQYGSELGSHMDELYKHFIHFGSPVMMGGETDNSSKGILGVSLVPSALLVLDPHYFGNIKCKEDLQKSGYVKWLPIHTFHQDSFYNLCLPMLKGS